MAYSILNWHCTWSLKYRIGLNLSLLPTFFWEKTNQEIRKQSQLRRKREKEGAGINISQICRVLLFYYGWFLGHNNSLLSYSIYRSHCHMKWSCLTRWRRNSITSMLSQRNLEKALGSPPITSNDSVCQNAIQFSKNHFTQSIWDQKVFPIIFWW